MGNKKVLIVTVAGMSTRFGMSLGRECIKCLYHEKDIKECLLYRLLKMSDECERFVIVGGYRYQELCDTIREEMPEFRDKILFVENIHFQEYGSGYSLLLGLRKALECHPEEIVFAEGDLHVDKDSYQRVIQNAKPVVTVNGETIRASKSVVFYYDLQYGIHYLYDLKHSALEIREPFAEIHNSGQIWKFMVDEDFQEVYEKMDKLDWQGTNLVFVQRYFAGLSREHYEIVRFQKWVNCNTVMDFHQMKEGET